MQDKQHVSMADLSPSQQWILNDAYEARGETIQVSFKSTNVDHERLVELGLFKRVMVKSGYRPEFGYRLTPEGYRTVNEQPNS